MILLSSLIAKNVELPRADERRRIANMFDDYSWVLPLYEDRTLNKVSDDVAEMIRKQIATVIRALNT